MELGLCCRPRRRRRGSSIWPSGPRRYGFSHVWTFDSHILWQEPYVIYSQILAETRNIIVGPMVTNPATRDWTVTASVLRHAQRDVRQPHGVRHRPRRLGGARHQRQADHDRRRCARSVHVIRELANGRERRLQGLDAALPVGGEQPRSRCGSPATARRRWRSPARSATGSSSSSPTRDITAWTIKAVREGGGTTRAATPAPSPSASRRRPTSPTDVEASPRPRAVPLVRRDGRQPRRRHRRPLRRRRRRCRQALTDYIKGRHGYDYNEHGQAGNTHTDVRARRDRRPLLHPRPGRRARRAASTSCGSSASTSSPSTSSTTPRTHTLQAYGERVMPAIAEHVRAKT